MSLGQWWADMPPITRTFLLLCGATTAVCSLELVGFLKLYYSFKFVWLKGEWWRAITTFLYFGHIRQIQDVIHLGLRVFFDLKYFKSLEETHFRNRPADFLWMLLVGAAMMLPAAHLVPEPMLFLSNALAYMVMYVWARRNKYVMINAMGLLSFQAPWLPWVMTGFHYLLGVSVYTNLLGIAAGHIYWYFEDVVPLMFPGAMRLMRTPNVLRVLFGQPPNGLQAPPPIRVVPGALIVRASEAHAHED